MNYVNTIVSMISYNFFLISHAFMEASMLTKVIVIIFIFALHDSLDAKLTSKAVSNYMHYVFEIYKYLVIRKVC